MMRAQFGSRRAFSLIELLTVIAIIAILSAIGVVATQGLLSSTSITGAAQHLDEVLSLARQYAVTRSRPVELRIYQQKGGTDFNGWQLVLYNSDLTVNKRLTKAQFLPARVVISSDTATNTSNLINPNNAPFNLPLSMEPSDGTITSGLTYASIFFSPSGGLKNVSPSPNYYYYLLLVPQNGNVTNINAPNRVVLSVDPISGVTQYSRQ